MQKNAKPESLKNVKKMHPESKNVILQFPASAGIGKS